jgi:hypothetical protein
MVWVSQSHELGVLAAEGLVLPDQLLRGGAAAVPGLDGGQDLLGVVVGALAAATGLAGLLGDGAMRAGEISGGVGDPTEEGYGGHGDGSSWVSGSPTTPPMRSILRTIKRVPVEACQVSS